MLASQDAFRTSTEGSIMRKWIAGAAMATILTGAGATAAVAIPASSHTPAIPSQSTQSTPTSQPPTSQPPTSEPGQDPGAGGHHKGDHNSPGKGDHGGAGQGKCDGQHERGRPMLRHGIATAAKTIGIAPKDLLTELKSGKSIADVAAAHHVDRQKVVDALVAQDNQRIDQAVKDKHLSQQRADALKKALPDRVAKFVDQHRK